MLYPHSKKKKKKRAREKITLYLHGNKKEKTNLKSIMLKEESQTQETVY